MSRFLTPAQIEPAKILDAASRPLFRVTEQLVFELGPPDSCDLIVVPAGRLTNLATLPRSWTLRWLYRSIACPDGPYIAAPILHDYLCNEQFPGNPQVVSGYTRLEAAALFRIALRSLKAPRWQSLSAYWAVRLNDLWQGDD